VLLTLYRLAPLTPAWSCLVSLERVLLHALSLRHRRLTGPLRGPILLRCLIRVSSSNDEHSGLPLKYVSEPEQFRFRVAADLVRLPCSSLLQSLYSR
jgi:hypothetical protein